MGQLNSSFQMKVFITVLCALVCSASAGLPGLRFPGLGGKKCPPKPETIKTFELDRYLGLWYEQKRVPASFQKDTSCVRAEYGLNDKGEVTVYNVATKKDGSFDDIRGTAYIPDPAHPGELKVDFPGVPVDGDYWILDTDYDNYAVVYACVDYVFGLIHFEFAWILARVPNANPALVQSGVDLLASVGTDVSIMEDTVQNDQCNYGDK